MGNIDKHTPKTSPTVEAIYAAYKAAGDAEPARGYLGASIIGHSCERYLWYCFRQACKEDIDGRIYRLFENGDLEEIRMVKDLRAIGCEVHEVDPQTGEQFEVKAIGGHFSGHMDGAACGIPEAPKAWHVLEFKTHNSKSYRKLQKEGVAKSKPMHFAQMQSYMGLTGMKRALYLAVNKDTEELYAERVHFDKASFEALMDKALRTITSTAPPERISGRPDYYECSWCSAHDVCWGSETSALPIASISCRQCCFATPRLDGDALWTCEKHSRALSPNDQDRACDDHLILPGFISFADPTNHGMEDGKDYIEFTNREPDSDGCATWRHGAGGWSTQELVKLSVSAVSNSAAQRAHELFGAEATRCTKANVQERYALDLARVVWSGRASGLQEAWAEKYGEKLADLKPVAEEEGFNFIAIEYAGERAVILNIDTKHTEIRQGIE